MLAYWGVDKNICIDTQNYGKETHLKKMEPLDVNDQNDTPVSNKTKSKASWFMWMCS